VCASGNLALLYLTGIGGRATAEEIAERHPGLIEGLASHPGIGIVLVRSASRGALAIGARGVHLLDERRVQGEDPLGPFGPLAGDRLRRLGSFTNVGDLVVVSRYERATEEVAAFEELIGSHGGLGGPQTEAFLVVPADWVAPEAPIVGAVAVNEQLRTWIAAELAGTAHTEPVLPAGSPATAEAGSSAPGADRVAAFDAATSGE
jgi:hypothetical protein